MRSEFSQLSKIKGIFLSIVFQCRKMHIALSTSLFLVFFSKYCYAQYQVLTDEVFVIQLSPSLFNLSDVLESSGSKRSVELQLNIIHQKIRYFLLNIFITFFHFTDEYFSYSASLHGLPDLPKWINLVFNQNLKLGFLYGTPPNNLASLRVIILIFTIHHNLTLHIYDSFELMIHNNVFFNAFTYQILKIFQILFTVRCCCIQSSNF